MHGQNESGARLVSGAAVMTLSLNHHLLSTLRPERASEGLQVGGEVGLVSSSGAESCLPTALHIYFESSQPAEPGCWALSPNCHPPLTNESELRVDEERTFKSC